MNMQPESYYISNINRLKERVKKIDKLIEDYKDERNSVLNEIDELRYNLSMVQTEQWINEAKEGKHKHITYAELPECVRQDLFSMIDKHKQDCNGTFEECDKCPQICIAKGYEEFKSKYNIEKIQF